MGKRRGREGDPRDAVTVDQDLYTQSWGIFKGSTASPNEAPGRLCSIVRQWRIS